MNRIHANPFRLLAAATAALLACGQTRAETSEEVILLTTPESHVDTGIGKVTSGSDTKRFSQYTGITDNTSVLQDLEIIKRDNATGLWTTVSARNTGLETRELNFSQKKQGKWKYAVDYNEIVRLDPYIIHTGMTGVGTTRPTIALIETPSMPAAWATANGLDASNGVQGNDVELKLKRTAYGVSADRWITPELQVEIAFRNEDKNGARMFGRVGMPSIKDMRNNPDATGASANGGWAILLTPEPIDSNTRTIESRLNFSRNKLALSVGYNGSFYANQFGSMTPNVPGTLNRGTLWTNCATVGCSTVQQLVSAPVALPPDNQSHQYFLTGNYAVSNTTRSNFRLAYTIGVQNESFAGMGLTPSASAPGSLGAVVNTTLAQFGLTMRPLPALSLNAGLRYEDRADKTPVYVYNTGGVTNNALNGTTNWPSGSQTRTAVKLDGIYRLANGNSVMLGLDRERKKTPLPPANTALFSKQIFFRPVLDETGVRAEYRKAISESLNGAVGAEYKQRRGNDNDWVTTSGTVGNELISFDPGAPAVVSDAGGNFVLPVMYMDRNRTRLRGNIDWDATKEISLQTVIEHSQDHYLRAFPASITPAQVVPVDAGARDITSDSLTLDSAYRITDDWKANGYWTRSYNRWNVNKANNGDDTRNTGNTVGLGVSGRATADWTVGLDILTTRDKTTFDNVVATGNTGGAGNIAGWAGQSLPGNFLPAINYQTDRISLRGKYTLNLTSDVSLRLTYQHFKTDDWQWGYNGIPFLFSDNTTVSQPMSQVARFFSASYVLRF
ncbi:MAG: MtrB/PioB family decaheme-associated outer membrane protein [Sideroxyarcus sp.]|nr:MtrB/PioB family decaheme-associated outer membrane protein [Sideroxyarcus sp.]